MIRLRSVPFGTAILAGKASVFDSGKRAALPADLSEVLDITLPGMRLSHIHNNAIVAL